jgi:23S rRNA pseudouridine2605 synthase
LATSGLLLLTSDTRLADWLTDPANAVARVYTVTVRGEVHDEAVARLTAGVEEGGEHLSADAVQVRKRSRRETHLVVRLHEGRNREIRRLFEAVGHEVTRLRRVSFGGFELGDLQPGRWREVTAAEVEAAIPAYCRP